VRRSTAAAVAAAAALVLAVVSAAITFPRAWSFAGDQRAAFGDLPSDPTLVFRYQQLLPARSVAFVRERVRAKERYFLLASGGTTSVVGVPAETATRTFARYALLPAVQVRDVRDADVVVALGRDPASLGLRYASVDRDVATGIAVARIAQ
jgi:hypothetical protein